MSKVFIPQDYHTPLSVYEMQRAIEFIKSNFQVNLSNALNLRRVSSPLTFPTSAPMPRSFIRWPSGSVLRSSATTSRSARACSPT